MSYYELLELDINGENDIEFKLLLTVLGYI